MDEREDIGALVEALRRSACDTETYSHDPDQAAERIKQAFSKIQAAEQTRNAEFTNGGKPISETIRALHSPKCSLEAIARLKTTIGLEDKEIQRIERIRVFGKDADGQLYVRIKALSPAMAATFLVACGVLLGLSISSVLIASDPGVALIVHGAGLGIAIGSLVGIILDRSIRLWPILKKLESAEDWLAARPGVSG